MRAYKFLDEDERAPFTGAEWTVGEWVETTDARPCHEGVHGCHASDLAYWFAYSLWEIELDGEVVESRHKVVGSRGRLLRSIAGYRLAVRELAEVGAWRTRDRAVTALGSAGLHTLADRVASATTLEDLAAVGADADVDDGTFAGRAAALAADAAHFALHGRPEQSPFVAACAAGHAEAGPAGDQVAYDAGFTAERVFQSAWLADRLALD